ncbi:hypothetical protein E1B28_007273 [Marasmius oreades]|uniref:Uncharacterized protein n=1 Tax=Marasmius oreades TaxID=181124 RepID=A0A9P7S1V5_9AGAR|nr:uncharacterized protein E1B28_007273 [Marasmius oreades]KAG7093608.1 hypothetical protein E1B28_007273 [Marasmius oreades]
MGPGTWPLVHLDNNQTLEARLLVSGGTFPFFKISWAYDTHGVVAAMCHPLRSAFEPPLNGFYQLGPIAFLPLSPTPRRCGRRLGTAAVLNACEPFVLARMINTVVQLLEASLQCLWPDSGVPTFQ